MACLFSPHWAIIVGLLGRILIANSTLQTSSIPEHTGTTQAGPAVSQASLLIIFFSWAVITSPLLSMQRRRGGEVHEWRMGRVHSHPHTGWIREWKRGESVTHTAGLGVDYRTPEEISYSAQTDSERGLTTTEPQTKHLHFFWNTQHYKRRRSKKQMKNDIHVFLISFDFMPNWNSTGNLQTAFTSVGASVSHFLEGVPLKRCLSRKDSLCFQCTE